LEEDADTAAVGAVARLWEGARDTITDAGRNALPRLRSGLKLQRCAGGPEAQPKSQYDRYLLEATDKLRGIGFGLQWGDWCSQKPSRDGERVEGYDTEFWEKKEDPVSLCKLVLRSSKKPADAIEALFNPDRKKLWLVDCGQFGQLAHYYALLRTRGAEEFNRMIGPNMEFKQLFSTGLKTKALWAREAKNEPMRQVENVGGGGQTPIFAAGVEPRPADEVIESAPVGSRVTFTNGFVARVATSVNASFVRENTMKVGHDAYVAHPFERGLITKSSIFTASEVKELMNQGTEPQFREHALGEIFISEVQIYDLP
jgi:hypothetical protein